MSHATVVRYTTQPGSADENEKLIKALAGHRHKPGSLTVGSNADVTG
jgi:hypothetical protein